MKLVIGGYAQGKLDYVKDNMINSEGTLIINDFHLLVKKSILEEKEAEFEAELDKLLKERSDVIIISDEIGNGIVPIDAFERDYREKTGRILIELAKQADEVVRVTCGIGQRIK